MLIGADASGRKELLAVEDGFRESAQSWRELLLRLRDENGLAFDPELATGDGALGFWQALHEVWPRTRHQRSTMPSLTGAQDRQRPEQAAGILAGPRQLRCHSLRGIGQSPMAKQDLHAIYEAENREGAEQAFDRFVAKYRAKYDKAAACLSKDREALLTFFDFPAEPLGSLWLPSFGTDHRLCR